MSKPSKKTTASTSGRTSSRQQPTRSSRSGAPSSPSLGTATATRQSRRRSADPYTLNAARKELEDKVDEEQQPVEASVSTPATVAEEKEEEEQPVASGSGQPRTDVPSGLPAIEPSESNYRLVVVQQPEIGAAAGYEKFTLGRLPIVPAPVVQLVSRDNSGELLDEDTLPFMFCSCSLKQEDGVSAVESLNQKSGTSAAVNEEFSELIGGLVRNVRQVTSLDGEPASYFVFEDLSVRRTGRFTLEFRLGEARPRSPKLAAELSAPFDVVPWREYPGRPVADTLTDLSRHLHGEGVPMYIPPLALNQPTLDPPPPGSNPFPATP